MNRYWVSWWSGYYEDEGCTKPPFDVWISGQKERHNYGLTEEQSKELSKIENTDAYYDFLDKNGKTDCSICACVDAKSEEEIWEVVAKHFPDYDPRFCEVKENDYNPSIGGRFTGGEGKRSLYES